MFIILKTILYSIVHAALYVMFLIHLCKQFSRLEDVLLADSCNHAVSKKNYIRVII